jgi:hypothetical protein
VGVAEPQRPALNSRHLKKLLRAFLQALSSASVFEGRAGNLPVLAALDKLKGETWKVGRNKSVVFGVELILSFCGTVRSLLILSFRKSLRRRGRASSLLTQLQAPIATTTSSTARLTMRSSLEARTSAGREGGTEGIFEENCGRSHHEQPTRESRPNRCKARRVRLTDSLLFISFISL